MNHPRRYSAPRSISLQAWAGIGIISLISGAIAALMIWTSRGHASTVNAVYGPIAVALLIMASAVITGRNWCGRTTVKGSGIVIYNLLWRHRIPWSRITSFEIKDVGPRSTRMYILCAKKAQGSPRALAGVMSLDSSSPEFLARISEIQQAWAAATGRTAVTVERPRS